MRIRDRNPNLVHPYEGRVFVDLDYFEVPPVTWRRLLRVVYRRCRTADKVTQFYAVLETDAAVQRMLALVKSRRFSRLDVEYVGLGGDWRQRAVLRIFADLLDRPVTIYRMSEAGWLAARVQEQGMLIACSPMKRALCQGVQQYIIDFGEFM